MPPPPPLAPGLAPVDATLDPCIDFEVYACGPRYGEHAILRRPGDLFSAAYQGRRRLRQQLVAGQHAGEFVGATAVHDYMVRCLNPAWHKPGIGDLYWELARVADDADLDALARSLGHLRSLGESILVEVAMQPHVIGGQPISGLRLALADSIVPATFYAPLQQTAVRNRNHWQRLAYYSGYVRVEEADVASRVDRWLASMHPWDVDRVRPDRLLSPGALEHRAFPWTAYFEGFGQSVPGPFMVTDPHALERIDALATLPLAALKSYVRVVLIEHFAMLLTQDMLDEEYRFHFLNDDARMSGSFALSRACPMTLPEYLRTDLERAYLMPLADRTSEGWAQRLMDAVRDRLIARIQTQAAVDGRIRTETESLLRRIAPLFVEETSTAAAEVPPGFETSLLRFYLGGKQADIATDLNLIGKPWSGQLSAHWSPAGVYVAPARIWLSPEILRPPYLTAPPWDGATYGGLGATIGHELAHLVPRALWPMSVPEPAAGTKSSASGLSSDWMSCMGQLFDKLTVSARIPYDLRSSLDEFMADLIGVSSAFDALEASAPVADAASDLQRQRTFFVAFAQSFCAMESDDRSNVSSSFDVHPSIMLRVNGVVSQSAAFARAFGCQPGQPMAPAQQCTPW